MSDYVLSQSTTLNPLPLV